MGEGDDLGRRGHAGKQLALHGIALGALRTLSLTTIAQPLGLMGQVAAQRLFDRMAGTQIDDRSIVLEPELLTRGTTAPPRV